MFKPALFWVVLILLQDANFQEPVRKFSSEEMIKLKLQYYNADIHRSAFVLPQFAKKVQAQLSNPDPIVSKDIFII